MVRATRCERRLARARSKPAPVKVVQSMSDSGSGVVIEEVVDDDDEEEDEVAPPDELGESTAIDTPEVCETSWGGLLALVTLSEKFNTPPAASP
jgi:hypothetical protein